MTDPDEPLRAYARRWREHLEHEGHEAASGEVVALDGTREVRVEGGGVMLTLSWGEPVD